MSQIVSSTKKLQLLEKTNEIEEEEREIIRRNVAQRNAKYQLIKTQNDLECLKSANEIDQKQEAAERRELLTKVKASTSDVPWLKPIVNLLENNHGNYSFLFHYLNLYYHYYLLFIFHLLFFQSFFFLFPYNLIQRRYKGGPREPYPIQINIIRG